MTNLNENFEQQKVANESSLLKETSAQYNDNYERVRVVGKGAFGTAVLCKRNIDGKYVIVKEIPMLPLSAGERQMALNEAKVLSKLDHPNIIRYHKSYEVDGILLIEMEFADGGNLQEHLSLLEERMEEQTILNFFQQMTSALMYFHDKRIIHRDLKTANIFLTSRQMIKVGDFGISKIVDTHVTRANTVIGTPYYLSPEMCEGKPYNEKSDIWAFGCILYEMATLHRTFDATNLPALVQKITKGYFAPIEGEYSAEFRELICEMLHQEPVFRPSAVDIWRFRLPPLLKQLEEKKYSAANPDLTSSLKSEKRSVLYLTKFNEHFVELIPVPLPAKIVVQQLAVSLDHMIALTNNFEIYVWGSNAKGQLGLDNLVPYVQHPLLASFFRGKSVKMIAAGDGFSIFSCKNGIVMTCGDGSKGCLGHGDWNSTSKPKIIEKLLCVNVSAIACGSSHVVIVGEEEFAFSWGCGLNGRLGHGNEETICSPMEIAFPEKAVIRNVRCGSDGTAFISSEGKVWCCGNNVHNKIGIDIASGLMFWKIKRVQQALIPTRVSGILRPVIDASLGINNSAFLLDNENVVTCGLNDDGQLGRGHTLLSSSNVDGVNILENVAVNMVSCGNTFTVIGTTENVVLSWGSRFVYPKHSIIDTQKSKSIVFDVNDSRDKINEGPVIIQKTFKPIKRTSLNPEEVITLYASPAQIANGAIISLSGIYTQGDQLYVLISTTIPVPHRNSCENSTNFNRVECDESLSQSQVTKKGSHSKNTIESTVEIPDWLEKELQDADDLWKKSAQGGIKN